MVKKKPKNNPYTLPILIGIVVLVLIILAFFIFVFASKKGPSARYVQQFDAAKIASSAQKTKVTLDDGIASLSLATKGFTPLATSYVDGCYATNDDSFANWHKACFAREVAYFGSNTSAGETKDQLSNLLTSAGWKNVSISGDSYTCYGYPLSTVTSYNLGFTATYQINDVNTPCTSLIPEKTSVLVPASDENNVRFSSLTHTTDFNATLASAKANSDKSVVAISVETEYYNQPLGFYLFK